MGSIFSLDFNLLVFVILLLSIHGGFCFYIPSSNPQSYAEGDLLTVKLSTLTSTKTHLFHSYYTLPYCRPNKTMVDNNEITPYVFKMQEEKTCNILCRIQLDAKSAKQFAEKIHDEYRVNMNLDNFPLVHKQILDNEFSFSERLGYAVGFKVLDVLGKEEKYFVNNHLSFRILFDREIQTNSTRIRRFEVHPFSVKHKYNGKWNEKSELTTCDPHAYTIMNGHSPQEIDDGSEVIFTYDVHFYEYYENWASSSTLDNYDPIRLYSIVVAFMVVVFLSGMILMILIREISLVLSNYNKLETREDFEEETGWKLVHSDVFRPPIYSDLLCVHVGAGVQFFMVILVIAILPFIELLLPSNQSWLMTTMMWLWSFMGFLSGYSSARLYKIFNGTEWKKIAFRTAVMFPSLLYTILFLLNTLVSPAGRTLTALVLLWVCISVPLVYIGSYIGFVKKSMIGIPGRINKIPRQIPHQVFYKNRFFTIVIGGILPFGVIFTETYFILGSIWLNQFYNSIGLLTFVVMVLIVTCVDISIIFCYFQLCGEDYRWWWRSFLTTGSSAIYLFLYATFYFFPKLEITRLDSVMLYFGYVLIASWALFVLTGTIGFYASFWFTRQIYSSIKID